MSGGSYNYVFGRIDDIYIQGQESDPRRAAFQKLLKLVAVAMKDIEWVDSADCGPGDEYKAIDAVFAFLGADAETVIKARAFDELRVRLEGYFSGLEQRS